MSNCLLPTPFHARTAEYNLANAWLTRGPFTVPAHYGDPAQEALAMRTTVGLMDISAQQDLRVEGPGAAALLSAACGPSVRGLRIGHSETVFWCADGGGLRGFGVLSRMADEDFLLRSADADIGWFAGAAARFGAQVRDATQERALLLLTGPYAIAAMVAARLEILPLEANRHAYFDWRGLAVRVFHHGRFGGYEISVAPEDATLAFDRLYRARPLSRLQLAGEEAFQLLQLESGWPLVHLDFTPARAPFARIPSPKALGFSSPERSEADAGEPVLAGLELESEQPLSYARIFAGETEIGRGLRALYSPSLKAAIALGVLTQAQATPGTILTLRGADIAGPCEVSARVVALPFL
jgi:aminomethyltransferase